MELQHQQQQQHYAEDELVDHVVYDPDHAPPTLHDQDHEPIDDNVFKQALIDHAVYLGTLSLLNVFHLH